MQTKIKDRSIVIVNQAANYLTIGLCNSFAGRFERVYLLTGNIHSQGESLDENVTVIYINKYHNSPPLKKLFSYLSACLRMYWLLRTRLHKSEVLFISLPPMGYLTNLLLSNKFSMIIWDIYPDVLKITGMKDDSLIYRLWGRLNIKSFKKAFRIFTIGEKMAESLSCYVARERIIVQPIWSLFQCKLNIPRSENPFIRAQNLEDKFVVQYSGNIGLTHKVEVLIQIAEMMTDVKDIVFQIIGRGPRVSSLKNMVEAKRLPNCFFLPFQADEMFAYSLAAAHIGIVILDESTSKGSVPSKSYNLMSFGIPSLYISAADSELFDYANKFAHARCFSSKDLIKAKDFILELYNDRELWLAMSEKALEASSNFKKSNADKFVTYYLNSD